LEVVQTQHNVCSLLNGASALFRIFVPIIVKIQHMRHVEKRFVIDKLLKNDFTLTSSNRNNVDVDVLTNIYNIICRR